MSKNTRNAYKKTLIEEPYVLISVISNETHWDKRFSMSLVGLLDYTRRIAKIKCQINVVSVPDLNKMRNLAVLEARRGGFTHIMELDSDQEYPYDIIEKFLKYNVDFVGPLVFHRKETDTPICYKKLYRGRKLRNKSNIPEFNNNGLTVVESSSVAGALIRMSVFDKIDYPYFKQIDKLSVQNGIEVSKGDGGDVFFSRKLKKVGVKILVDSSVSSPHFVSAKVEKGVVEVC